MPDEIHVHVPKGAKVIIHEDEPEPERELTLDEKIDELLRLAQEAAGKQMIQLVPMPYPVYPQPILPLWIYTAPSTAPFPTIRPIVTCGSTNTTAGTLSSVVN